MLLGLKNAQALVGLITIFLSYLITIALAGYFRAWVAKKMGDETAEDLGFLTLNPLVHIDLFGLLVLLLFSNPRYFYGFGWGKHIPINPAHIHGPRRWLKLACAFFSDSFAHFIIATVALTSMSIIFGKQAVAMASVHQVSSFNLVIFQLLFAFIGLNIALVLVQAVINGVLLVALYMTENGQVSQHLYYFVLLAPIIILLLFGSELQLMLYYGISAIESAVASIL